MPPLGRLYGLETQSPLLSSVARSLELPIGNCLIGSFADGERQVRFQDDLGGTAVVLVVSTSPPVDSNLLTLAMLADAARRAGARAIVAAVPYFGYSRSERMAEPGTPIGSRVAADLLQASGVTHMVAVDLHSPAIPGFFTLPVIELSAIQLLASAFQTGPSGRQVVVAPDAGATKRVSAFASKLGLPMAVSAKHRLAPDAPRVLEVWGEVEGKEAILLDDMISTGGTLEQVALILKQRGVLAIDVAVTHPVMAPGAEERLRRLGIRRFVTTDTIPFRPATPWEGFETLSIAPLLSGAIAQCLRGV